ncbi:MAG: aldo/keto reductase [Chloroflexi bacterium]|nr:aldo/keto reductase [Chloroflexota bacterium]
MKTRPIPHTSLDVSPICLGTMTFGTPVSEPEAIGIVHWAVDHGINFIDTANVYEGYRRVLGSPGGVAEEILGQALAGRRHQVILATKVGNPNGPGPDDRGLGRTHILRECDRSLRRLKTETIDIYYMHRPDPQTPVAASIAGFVELIRAGKVRLWGLSNFDATQTREILTLCDGQGWPRPVMHQPPYSLLKRQIEVDLLPLCRQEQIAVVPYQVLQSGLLTGKYLSSAELPPDSRAVEKPEWLPQQKIEETRDQLRALEAQSQTAGLSLYDYTLQTTVTTPGITSIILGVKNIGQVENAIRALDAAGI